MRPYGVFKKWLGMALLATACLLYPVTARTVTVPVPCDCTHLIDLQDMLDQIDLYLLGYRNAAHDYETKGKRDPSANEYRKGTVVTEGENIRVALTRPAHYDPAHQFGGRTDPDACSVTLTSGMNGCISSLTDLHEQHHAAVCNKTKLGKYDFLGRTIDFGSCMVKGVQGVGCGYQSDWKLSDVFLEEVAAYKLQRTAVLAQIEIAKKDLVERQLTCEWLLSGQDTNYRTYLSTVLGAAFKWLFP